MKKYAYLDKGDILHIVGDRKTAKEASKNGKVIETELLAEGGYPLAVVKDKKEEIIVYSPDNMRVTAQDKESLDVSLYPELAELWKRCK